MFYISKGKNGRIVYSNQPLPGVASIHVTELPPGEGPVLADYNGNLFRARPVPEQEPAHTRTLDERVLELEDTTAQQGEILNILLSGETEAQA